MTEVPLLGQPEAPHPVTLVYCCGAANNRIELDRLAALAGDLGEASPEAIVSYPNDTSTITERLAATIQAHAIVLLTGWERDVEARKEAQLAVWTDKVLLFDAGLRRPGVNGSARHIPVLHNVQREQVANILDRGLGLALPLEVLPTVDEPTDGEAAEGQG